MSSFGCSFASAGRLFEPLEPIAMALFNSLKVLHRNEFIKIASDACIIVPPIFSPGMV